MLDSFGRLLAGTVALLSLLCLIGCGGGAKGASVPVVQSPAEISALLGRPADVTLIVRPRAMQQDPNWGPVLRHHDRSHKRDNDYMDKVPPDQTAAAENASDIELYIALRDPARFDRDDFRARDVDSRSLGFVAVVRDVSGISPTNLTTRRGDRVFNAPRQLPSGASEYSPGGEYARRIPFAPWLYVMPDGSWVMVDDVTASRLRRSNQTSIAEPDLDDGALIALFVSPTIMSLASSHLHMKRSPWRSGLRGAGLVLHNSSEGAVEFVLDYRSEDHAARSASWAKKQLSDTCDDELACLMAKALLHDVVVVRNDERVAVRFFLSEALLRRILRTGSERG